MTATTPTITPVPLTEQRQRTIAMARDIVAKTRELQQLPARTEADWRKYMSLGVQLADAGIDIQFFILADPEAARLQGFLDEVKHPLNDNEWADAYTAMADWLQSQL